MENPSFIEKRNFPRFPINIPLVCFDSATNQTQQTQTQDISAEGLCIITEKELSEGTCLEICIKIEGYGEDIQRKGKVVWSKKIDCQAYRCGVKLEGLKLKPVSLVLQTIKTQRKY